MALTTDQLGVHLGLIEDGTLPEPDQTKLTLIRQAAEAEISEYVGSSVIPSAVLDTALVRLAGYLWDERPTGRNKNLNPLRASGAMGLLVRHRTFTLGDVVVLTNSELQEQGFTAEEITRLKELSASEGFLKL